MPLRRRLPIAGAQTPTTAPTASVAANGALEPAGQRRPRFIVA
ncbi:hypothetical protein [Natrinema sp. 1APR25-10V2]|nr:hypothetical protein [Natrinema sp. 1APR25-10V2]